MNSKNRIIILEKMLEQLELPMTAYEKARTRYEDLGKWFSREDSLVKGLDPHIFVQGSFRLGTANRPLEENEPYDLDLSCKLKDGVTTVTHSQKDLKNLIGKELEAYRQRRGIQKPPEPKHRCWRLQYQDEMSFHMDVVPCIPAESRGQQIAQMMMKGGTSESFASLAAQTTVHITDDRHDSFGELCEDWNISNPEGYAKWFEEQLYRVRRLTLLEKAKVDEVPLFRRKTPLQRVVQLLKRHRDQMFRDEKDSMPISIVITTLAAQAYQGEQDLETALTNILARMGTFVRPSTPRVPNPVDPNEDFADRWSMSECRHLNLEQNFWNWLDQAKTDFEAICNSEKVDFIGGQARKRFALHLNEADLAKNLGISQTSTSQPKVHVVSNAAPPWTADSDET